jgi:hypothetical protein
MLGHSLLVQASGERVTILLRNTCEGCRQRSPLTERVVSPHLAVLHQLPVIVYRLSPREEVEVESMMTDDRPDIGLLAPTEDVQS